MSLAVLATVLAVGCSEGAAQDVASTTIGTTPRTLTSIPFCDAAATALADSYEGPQQPDASFWAREQKVSDYGFAVEAAYGSTPTWSGWFIAPDRSLVFRFTNRDPERDAAIAVIVEGHPHSFLQVGFTVAERQQAHDRLIEAWEASGEDIYLTGIGVEGLHPLVEIELSNHDQVELLAERIGLPPPYDIYCINPREIIGGPASWTGVAANGTRPG